MTTDQLIICGAIAAPFLFVAAALTYGHFAAKRIYKATRPTATPRPDTGTGEAIHKGLRAHFRKQSNP